MENTPFMVLQCRLAWHVLLASTCSLAELWPKEIRSALLREIEPTVYRDFSLSLSQACIGAESVLPGIYWSVFSLKQLFPHSLCSSLSFLLSAAP